MNKVPGLLRSSREGLEGDRGDEEAEDEEPSSMWRLDLGVTNTKWIQSDFFIRLFPSS